MGKQSFVSILEELEQELLDWAKKYEDDMVKRLSPDGRPFGMEKKSKQEMLQEYMQLRGNPVAWMDFLAKRVEVALQQVADAPQDEVAAKHIYDIVFRWAIKYSLDMERLLEQESARAGRQEEVPEEAAFGALE